MLEIAHCAAVEEPNQAPASGKARYGTHANYVKKAAAAARFREYFEAAGGESVVRLFPR